MKKEEVENLIREYLALKKQIDHLQEELRAIRDSFGKTSDLAVLIEKEGSFLGELMKLKNKIAGVEGLLYSYRSKDFIQPHKTPDSRLEMQRLSRRESV